MRTSGDETAALVSGRSPPISPPQSDVWSGAATASHSTINGIAPTLVSGAPDYAAVYFYKSSTTQRALYLLGSVATLGALPVVTIIWLPQWYTRLTKRQVASADDADFVLVRAGASELGGDWDERELFASLPGAGCKWFDYRKHRHVYDAKKRTFTKLKSELRESLSDVGKRTTTGFTSGQAEARGELFGPNEIAIAALPWSHVLLRKVLHPFYLFQVASALIWLSERYTTYALLILAMSALSIAWEVVSQVRNDQRLHDLVKVDASVKVVRDQHVASIAAHQLVVGDIVVVEAGLVPADIVLIAGECTADESTLTGEAIPVTKRSLASAAAAASTVIEAKLATSARESVLFAGSSVLAGRGDGASRGVVLATGFSTAKGELFRAILYPAPLNLRIERDSYLFLAALSVVALIAFIKRVVQASSADSGVSTAEAIVSALDLVTIAVPPALPLVLTIGVGFALTRLEAAGVVCINSQRINLAGHVDCFCFDKTGTLSSDHLDFQGVDECAAATAATSRNSSSSATDAAPTLVGLQSEVDVLSTSAIVGLATCHALTERNGAISGYALERDMFRATGYSLEMNAHRAQQSHQSQSHQHAAATPFAVLISSPIGKTFGVVQRFVFDAALQRSSVLVEDFETGQRTVFTKGSPEAVRSVCTSSTLPRDFADRARAYAYQGYYVVALASKAYPVTADVPARAAMECRLTFLGFVLFLNKIKPEAPYVIASLEDARVDVRIITGDNAFTAVHVARKVNLTMDATVLLLDVADDIDSTDDKSSKLTMVSAATPTVVFADVDDLAARRDPEWTPLVGDTFLAFADHCAFAITGAALDALIATQPTEFVARVVLHAKVFARIRPQQKTWVVETLMARGKCVGMVGDGTNDCGALKAAHVGLALSTADASLVAPFTSRLCRLADVLALLREGRGALSTAFVAFRYMVLYSLTQLTLASLLHDAASQLSNDQFLFDDLVVVFGLSVLMVRTRARDALSAATPATSLFAPEIVWSLAGQLALLLASVSVALAAARGQSWFCAADVARDLTRDQMTHHNSSNSSVQPIDAPCYVFVPGVPSDLTQHSYENSVLWLFGHMQYWLAALVLNARDAFRQPLVANRPFALYLAGLAVALLVQLFSYKSAHAAKTVGVDTTFGVRALPASFCAALLALFVADLVLALAWELVVVGVVLRRYQETQQQRNGASGAGGLLSWFSSGRASGNGSAQSVSPFQTDREGLLGGCGSGDGPRGADAVHGRRKSKAGDNDDDNDEDEEEDVLTNQMTNQAQPPEIVYVEYTSS